MLIVVKTHKILEYSDVGDVLMMRSSLLENAYFKPMGISCTGRKAAPINLREKSIPGRRKSKQKDLR